MQGSAPRRARARTAWLVVAIAVTVLAVTSAQALAVPVAKLEPTTLAFVDAAGGGASAAQTVTLTNTGDGVLAVPSVSIDPPSVGFAITGNTCTGANLENGQSCTVDVTYAATDAAPRGARLRIGASTVALTGNALTASPSRLDFTAQLGTVSPPQFVTLTNRSSALLKLSQIGLAGASQGRFAIDSAGIPDACGTSLGAGASCRVGVRFLPEGEGPREAVLRIRSPHTDTMSLDLDVPLSGVGTPGPAAAVAPSQLSFTTRVGTTSGPQQVRLTNAGTAPLSSIEVSVVGADFRIAASTCGPTLAPAERCTVDVTFTPPAAADGFAAVLRFTSDDPARPTLDVPLTGTGTAQAPASANAAASTKPPTPAPPDGDKDGVRDAKDACPTAAGERANGCPRKVKANVRVSWSLKAGQTKLLSLVVVAPVGTRIELRCSGKRRAACGFTKRTITRTKKSRTALTRYFKGRRILPAGVSVIVRVMRPRQTGVYERFAMRSGGKSPRVVSRCLSSRSAKVVRCT